MPLYSKQELSKSELLLLRQAMLSIFIYFTLFNPHNNPVRESPLLSSHHREESEAQRS